MLHHIPELIIRSIKEDYGKVRHSMSKSEDYLEQLVNGTDPQDVLGASGESSFDDILEEFTNENDNTFDEVDLFGDEFLDEDFLKEFEQEMAKLENEPAQTADVKEVEVESEPALTYMDDLDSILNGAREQMNTAEQINTEEPEVQEEVPAYEQNSEGMSPAGEEDVLQLFDGLGDMDIASEEETGTGAADIGEFAFEESVLAEESMPDGEPETEGKKKKKRKKEKDQDKKEKNGFLKKLGLILFGEEEEEVSNAGQGAEASLQGADIISIEGADDANLALFGVADTVIPEEETKGKKKKEKKKKEKKEKVKKEKKPKPKKEKKPKPPKEPDNTPPLPKKPVALIFVMAASLVVLVMIGADLLGYSNQLTNAQNRYNKKQYTEAFAELSGMEIKEEDLQLYHKYHVMAMVSAELEAYDNLMTLELYDMALDSLVRTIGRAGKYKEDAELYGCAFELNEIELAAEAELKETFGISKEKALEFYAYRSKKEYSAAIANVLKELGLEM